MSKPLAIDLYCGLGGWAQGFLAEGYDVVGFDIERHDYGTGGYPGQLVLQDVLTLHGSQFKDATVIVASPPCFVADTLILTNRGLIPIPEVIIGDLVLTHHNRWRRVLRAGSTIATTVIASGYGAVIEGTADHPIYARRDVGSYRRRAVGERLPVYQPKCLDQPEWVPLAESAESHWASPAVFDPLPVPRLPNAVADTLAFWWMVGRWVGDGWVRRRHKTRSGDEVLICCAHSEADNLENHLAAVAPRTGSRAKTGELHWRRSAERTTARFTSASNALAEWLTVHFGSGAATKSWPAWALGMEESRRQALLDGYVSADGNHDFNGRVEIIKTTTVSKRLAIGTRFLAASLGCAAATYRQPRPPTCEIEGRVVNQRDGWDTRWTPGLGSNRLVERAGGMQWGVVRNVTSGQASTRVWNIEVEDDNSYVADGVVVHNCQKYSYMAMPWSKAKALIKHYEASPENRAELTALFDACFRIQREASEAAGRHIPMVVENVRGAQRWVGRAKANYGSFFLWGDVGMVGRRVVAGPSLEYGQGVSPVRGRMKANPDGTAHPVGSWFAVADSKERGAHTKNNGGSWFAVAHNTESGRSQNPVHALSATGVKAGGVPISKVGFNVACVRKLAHGDSNMSMEEGRKTVGHVNQRDGHTHARHLTNQAESDGVKGFTPNGERMEKNVLGRMHGSKSPQRKAASAAIAKIPFPLASYIARAFRNPIPESSADRGQGTQPALLGLEDVQEKKESQK